LLISEWVPLYKAAFFIAAVFCNYNFFFKRRQVSILGIANLFFLTKTIVMNSQKFLVGGIVGGIIYFLLGWVIYGMLLKDFMAANSTMPMRADADIIWWALAVGQLAGGFLMAYIVGKANATSAGAGAAVGFIVGLLFCLSMDLTMYATTTAYSSMKALAADVAASAVMSAIVGGVVGWVMGMKKAVATA
jgi:hypothetical protein